MDIDGVDLSIRPLNDHIKQTLISYSENIRTIYQTINNDD